VPSLPNFPYPKCGRRWTGVYVNDFEHQTFTSFVHSWPAVSVIVSRSGVGQWAKESSVIA
jgi:hypothetical protein